MHELPKRPLRYKIGAGEIERASPEGVPHLALDDVDVLQTG